MRDGRCHDGVVEQSCFAMLDDGWMIGIDKEQEFSWSAGRSVMLLEKSADEESYSSNEIFAILQCVQDAPL